MVQQIFTLVPRLNPSLGFVTMHEIWSTENTNNNNNNNNKKQRRNLDSGAFRPRVKTTEHYIKLSSISRLLITCT